MTVKPANVSINVSIDVRHDTLSKIFRSCTSSNKTFIERIDENGDFHSDDDPAFITSTFKSWWFHGKRHRLDGPAVVSDKTFEWWIDGVLLRSTTVDQGSTFPQFNLHVVMHLLKCDSSIADSIIKLFLEEL